MLLKSCRCGKLIPQSMKMCEECEQRQQSRHMIYNNTRRDERAAEFYVSKEWRAMRERIIEVYDNVDIYALYVEHELLTCNPVHHIIELEDDWEQRLNPFNLIPLNHKTHNTKTGLVTIDGANAFDKVNMWTFPVLKTGETALTFSNTKARVTIRYTPMWI